MRGESIRGPLPGWVLIVKRLTCLCCLALFPPACARPQTDKARLDAEPAGATQASAPTARLSVEEWTNRYDLLLRPHVWRGRVDYRGLNGEQRRVDELVQELGPSRRIEDPHRRLAFLINAYNLRVIGAVLDNGGATSPGEITGFFDRRRRTVLGAPLTLDELRDRLIRPA